MAGPALMKKIRFLLRIAKDNKIRIFKKKWVKPDSLPLNGIRILDVTHVWAGPHTTRLLADWGAEVIRVENSSRMDISRSWFNRFRLYNVIPDVLQLNRNKRSVTLNLKTSRGLSIFKDLLKISDVVTENMRPGAMRKLGLGYHALCQIKPDIIMVSMSGFGSSGAHASYRAYGATLEGLSGLQSLTAYEKNGNPMRIKELDMLNGLHGASAIMTALVYRQKSGKGQWIDLSQLETSTAGLIGEHLLEYAMNGSQTLPTGNRNSIFAPQGCYPCKGHDQWVAIAIQSDREWDRFCAVTGHVDWKTDKRFYTRQDRLSNHDALDELIGEWTVQFSHYEVMHQLQKKGIAAGAVLKASEICWDPHVINRQFVKTARDSGSGGLRFPGLPFKFADGNGDVFWRGPKLGEDNAYVITKLLNRPNKDKRTLRPKVIGTAFDLEEDDKKKFYPMPLDRSAKTLGM